MDWLLAECQNANFMAGVNEDCGKRSSFGCVCDVLWIFDT